MLYTTYTSSKKRAQAGVNPLDGSLWWIGLGEGRMDMMKVWWVASAHMSSMLHPNPSQVNIC